MRGSVVPVTVSPDATGDLIEPEGVVDVEEGVDLGAENHHEGGQEGTTDENVEIVLGHRGGLRQGEGSAGLESAGPTPCQARRVVVEGSL